MGLPVEESGKVDPSSPETWRWIWLIASFGFAVGEITIAGSFFLAPFAVGAGVAAVVAFADLSLGVEWAVFLAISMASFAAMRPLARHLDAGDQALGVGAHRQVGQRARVIEPIEGEHDHGTVLLGREQWRAESGSGQPIPAGATVVVTDVRGTRVIVELSDPLPPGLGPPPGPPLPPPGQP